MIQFEPRDWLFENGKYKGSYVTPHNGHFVFSEVCDVSKLSHSNQVCEAGKLDDTELHTCINTGKITDLNNIEQWVKLIKSGNWQYCSSPSVYSFQITGIVLLLHTSSSCIQLLPAESSTNAD